MKDSSTMKWSLPITPLTLNAMLNASHWGPKQQNKKRWQEYVNLLIGKRKRRIRRRVLLKIKVYRFSLQDPDNKVGSVKYLVDALKLAGWLCDDTPEFLELEVEEVIERDKELQRTEITWQPKTLG